MIMHWKGVFLVWAGRFLGFSYLYHYPTTILFIIYIYIYKRNNNRFTSLLISPDVLTSNCIADWSQWSAKVHTSCQSFVSQSPTLRCTMQLWESLRHRESCSTQGMETIDSYPIIINCTRSFIHLYIYVYKDDYIVIATYMHMYFWLEFLPRIRSTEVPLSVPVW